MILRRLLLLITFILGASYLAVAQGPLNGASPYVWYNPLPTGANLNAAIDVGEFVIVAGDRGNALQNQSGSWSTIFNFPNVDITGMSSPLFNTAYVTGTGSASGLYRSTNGCFIWNQILPDTITEPLMKVCFGNQSIALIAGSDGNIWRTNNEGASWRRTASPSNALPTVLKSIGISRFFYATNAGGLFYSDNNGISFQSSSLPTSEIVNDASFIENTTNGFLCTNQGKIYRTTDNGANWALAYTTPSNAALACVRKLNGRVVMALGGNIRYFSFDGGQSWASTPQSRLNNGFELIMADTNRGYLFDRDGDIFTTLDGGGTFNLFNQGFYTNINAGAIRPNLSNEIMLAADGGGIFMGQTTLSVSQNLDYTQLSTLQNLYGISKGIQQISPIIVGDSGVLFSSASPNGSLIWTKRTTPTTQRLKAVSGNQGYILAVGNNGTVIRSLNQAQSWQSLPSQGFNNWNDVYLLEQSNALDAINRGVGLVVGDGGKILRYTSFSNSVSQINLGSSENLVKINAVAGGKVYVGSSTGKLYASGDYGQNFFLVAQLTAPIRAITGFRSNDLQVIDGKNFIYHIDEAQVVSADYIPTSTQLNGAIYAEVGVGAGVQGGNIVFGNNGNLLANTFGIITSTDAVISKTSNGLKVYPNPAVNECYFVLEAEKVRAVNVYDMQGKKLELSISLNTTSLVSTGTINIDVLAKGSYLLVAETASGRISQRIIKN